MNLAIDPPNALATVVKNRESFVYFILSYPIIVPWVFNLLYYDSRSNNNNQ